MTHADLLTLLACLLVVAWAIPLTLWLRAEGDRSWARHQARRRNAARTARLGTTFATLAINLGAFTDAARKASLAAMDFQTAMDRVGKATGRPLSDYTRKGHQ